VLLVGKLSPANTFAGFAPVVVVVVVVIVEDVPTVRDGLAAVVDDVLSFSDDASVPPTGVEPADDVNKGFTPPSTNGWLVDGSDSFGPDGVNGDVTNGDGTVAAVELVDTDGAAGLLSVDDGRSVEVVGDVTTGKLFSGAPVDSDVNGVLDVVEVLVLN